MLMKRSATVFLASSSLLWGACKQPASQSGYPDQGASQAQSQSGDAADHDALGTKKTGRETSTKKTETATTETTGTTTTAAASQPQTAAPVVDPYAKYSYQNPNSFALQNPHNVKLYNYLKEGIVSVNGKRLSVLVPPGKTMVLPKLYEDLDDNGNYLVRVQTESGAFGVGTFEAVNVNMGDWRASVDKDANGLIVVKENAGGGGGSAGGGSGGGDLSNFN